MTAARRITAFFNIKPGEERLIGLLVLFYFVLSMAFVFIQSIAFGMFLSEYGPQGLPYSYISIAILASLAAVLYIKTSEKVSFSTLLMINMASLGIISLIIWVGLKSSYAHYVSFFLPLLFQVVANMGNLAAWTLAGHTLDFRQGKRLFPLVAAGLWLANSIGGVLVSPLVEWVGTINLLLLAVASIGLSMLVLRSVTKTYVKAPAAIRVTTRSSIPKKKPEGLFKNRHVVLILAYTVLWWMLFFFLDNIFSDRASAQFPSVDQLTAFMGQLLSVTGVLALLITTLLAGPIINRFGVRGGLIGMPLLTTIIVIVMVMSGSMGGTLTLVFSVGAIAKLMNVALGFSLSQAAIAIVFQTVPDAIRGQTHAMAEGVMQPIATGLAGVGLLALTAGLKFNYLGLAYVLIGIAVVWIVVILMLSNSYVSALTQAITRRRFGESQDALTDPATIAILQDHLHNVHPGPAIYALTKLDDLAPEAVINGLPRLVQHPAAEVRREAFLRIERLRLNSALQPLSQQLKVETDPSAREVGLQALGAIADPQSISQLTDALKDSSMNARRGALVGLLKYGNPDAVQVAEQTLDRMVDSVKPEDRELAAQVLGRVDLPRFDEAEKRLLHDPEPQVRNEALRAAGKMKRPALLPIIIDACGEPETSHAAASALITIGANGLPEVELAFSQSDTDRQKQSSLARVLGRTGGKTAQELLRTRIKSGDSKLRTQILNALSESGYREHELASINPALKIELSSVARACAVQNDLGGREETVLLYAALEQYILEARERVLLLLSFAFDEQSILKVREALLSGSKTQLGYALEIMDTQLPAELRRMVIPVLEDLPFKERLQRLAPIFPQTTKSIEERLLDLIGGFDGQPFTNWVQVCAVHSATRLYVQSSIDVIETATTALDPLLSATARWSMAQLSPETQKGTAAMLSTVEKVIILKTVNMFKETPDEVLADVANLLEETEASEGEAIIKQGEFGDSMFIIVDGKVHVHDGDRHINNLGERDVFGEMALLDAEPRMASVTAMEPTQLFRLEQGPFYELLEERPEIATGIIHVLTQRLRERILGAA